jgi:F-type H+-transporting ATPase subunit epsilon
MRMKILLPERVLLDQDVDKIVANSIAGSFCLEPRHIDYVAPVVPGILAYEVKGREFFVGTGHGVIVKAGDEVLISLHDAVTGADLGEIRDAVEERLRRRQEWDERVLQVASQLEARLVQRYAELQERGTEVK